MPFLFKIFILNFALFFIHPLCSATQTFGYASVSVNYLDWTDKTEKRSLTSGLKKDFMYLEVEGLGVYNWGTLYGFYDVENIGKSPDGADGRGLRTATKAAATVKIFDSNWSLYAHIYQFSTDSIQEQNRVYGVSYTYKKNAFMVWPFIAAHDVVTVVETPQGVAPINGYSGNNGLMLGWNAKYDYSKFLFFFWWHESELLRPDTNGINGIHKKNEGHNGALSLWYKKHSPLVFGLQYRYADRKLGTPTYQDAFIFTVKHHL